MPRLLVTSRCVRPSSHLSLRISRVFRMDSLSFAISPPWVHRKERDGPRFRIVQRRIAPPSTTRGGLWPRSRSSGIGVQIRPESAFTFPENVFTLLRNRCSRYPGMGIHVPI
jgi:hypothetical protein